MFVTVMVVGIVGPNERKLEFQSTGLDSYQIVMYERGLHTMSKTIPKARGIDNRLVDYIDQQCKARR